MNSSLTQGPEKGGISTLLHLSHQLIWAAHSSKCQFMSILQTGTELGPQECPAVAGHCGESTGLSAVGLLGFARHSSVCSPARLSWKL